jgi:ELWxxDGT repeat protein
MTDGTAAGTRLLRDICRGPCDADPWILGIREDRLLLAAHAAGRPAEIWSSDGTSQGTVRVSRLGTDWSVRPGGLFPWSVEIPTGILFAASDPVHGEELWALPATGSLLLSGHISDPDEISFH